MSVEKANPQFIEQARRLGAPDLAACYSCGQCSAVCPLTTEESSFPRRMIRLAMLGLEKQILASPELWLCYYCGECSETCPRQADPGALMMALRRFAVRRYSLGRFLSRFVSPWASFFAYLLLAAAASVGVALFHNPAMNRLRVDFLSFFSLSRLHDAGIVIVAFIALIFLANIIGMARTIRLARPGPDPAGKPKRFSWWPALRESAWQQRFGECESNRWRRLAHLGISWGFAGMFLATVIIGAVDFRLLPLPRWVSLVIGSLSGLAASLGLGYFFIVRIGRRGEYGKRSEGSDWNFLTLLALAVLSGFAMVGLRFLAMPMAAYWTFAIHLVAVFVFLVALPFSKFAHFIYRPIALWLAGIK